MIEGTGQVIKVSGDVVQIETEPVSSCGSCAVKTGCGTAVLARVLGTRRNRVWALNPVGAQKGDRVVVGLPEQALVRGSIALYGIPLVGLLVGALLGKSVGGTESFTIVGAVLGLGGGLVWLRDFGRRVRTNVNYQAMVLRQVKVSSTSEPVSYSPS